MLRVNVTYNDSDSALTQSEYDCVDLECTPRGVLYLRDRDGFVTRSFYPGKWVAFAVEIIDG